VALGQAWIVYLARLASLAEFTFRRTLTVTEIERVEAELPGWWQQMMSAQRREVRRVLSELLSTRGMMPLLMKVRNGGQWTPEEKEEILGHMRRMVHLSPYLVVMVMPGSMLFLPIYAWWLDRRRLRRDD
jgi:hypothetical protein